MFGAIFGAGRQAGVLLLRQVRHDLSEPRPHIAAFTVQLPFSYATVASGAIYGRVSRATYWRTEMRRIFKTAVLGLAVAATALSGIPAQADHRWHRHHRHHDRGDELAAGLAGLAIGAIVGGILTQPSHSGRVYIDPPAPRYRYRYYGPAPVYSGPVTYHRAEPWSAEWYRACSIRFRSFDPRSGTYLGYDGHRHFCVIR